MKAKPVIPRSEANRDVDEAIAHYLTENAEHAALGFIDALEEAYAHIARLLAVSVVGDDGLPLLTEAEWEAFGGSNFEEALDLFGIARRLSGLDAEVIEKN